MRLNGEDSLMTYSVILTQSTNVTEGSYCKSHYEVHMAIGYTMYFFHFASAIVAVLSMQLNVLSSTSGVGCFSPSYFVNSINDCILYWQLVFGNCGVLQGISQGKGFVNMSTVDVETAHDVCEVH